MSKNVIITGATGMIGGQILEECLKSSEIAKITSLVRRVSGIKHEKLNEILVDDFSNFEGKEDLFVNQDLAFYCAGVYTGAVGVKEFRVITVDQPMAFAQALHKSSSQAVFCLLSGSGADRTEKSKMMFAKDKGAVENGLDALGFKAFYSFRPAYIYPVVARKEPNLAYKVTRFLYPVIKLFGSAMSVKSTELAHAMVEVGLNGHSSPILENMDIVQKLRS